MRLHFIDRLNIDRIGTIYGVHRATVPRWLVAIRQRVFDRVKDRFADLHGLGDSDVKSLFHLLEGDLHLPISRLLR